MSTNKENFIQIVAAERSNSLHDTCGKALSRPSLSTHKHCACLQDQVRHAPHPLAHTHAHPLCTADSTDLYVSHSTDFRQDASMGWTPIEHDNELGLHIDRIRYPHCLRLFVP